MASWISLKTSLALAGVVVLSAMYAWPSKEYHAHATTTNFAVHVSPAANPKRILFALPRVGFDPTEASVPWKVLSDLNHRVDFATPDGKPSEGADPHMLTGFWFGLMKIDSESGSYYKQMTSSAEYQSPVAFSKVDPRGYDAIFIPGGHAPGMETMLQNEDLLQRIPDFWLSNKPVAAICHGILAVARSKSVISGHSLLYETNTTALPKWMESQFYFMTHYLFRMPGPKYSLSQTWPRYVEDEIRSAQRDPDANFLSGPLDPRFPAMPGTNDDPAHAFVVRDGHYLSARAWGDSKLLALRLAEMLAEQAD